MPNSQSITATQAATAIGAFTTTPYGNGGSPYTLLQADGNGLLNTSASPGVVVTLGWAYGRDGSGNFVLINYAADDSDGSPLPGTNWFANGTAVSKAHANSLIAAYAAQEDSYTPGIYGNYCEYLDAKGILAVGNMRSSPARESNSELNVVMDDGTVYFNVMKPRPR
ncbi:MAG TPA: hypothetical protein VEC36_00280 [Patescibacteria group bacterium]|nr:hypothetical protein [Patescibacteria group bacterium]